MKLVEDKLAFLEKQKQQKNNGQLVLSEIDALIKKSIAETIQEANITESIDARIKMLVSGLQKIMDILNSYGSSFLKDGYLLDAKISVLEELMDNYLANENNENTQE